MFSLSLVSLCSCEKDSTSTTSLADLPAEIRNHTTAFAYVSSNTSGLLGIYPVGVALANPGSVTGTDSRVVSTPYDDADGIVYDEKRNAIYQVNRTDSRLVAYSDVDGMQDGDMIIPGAIGPASFTNGREATFYNNKVVVADDITPGRLASYHVNEDQINDFRWHDVGFEVWGIQATSKDLWAIVDVSSDLAYFQNYFREKSGPISPTAQVTIEGLVRTHGLNYDEDADVMVLTDIGSAASGDDGGLIIINDFWSKYMNAASGSGMIPMSEQIRIYGPMSELGNPVDVAVHSDSDMIFVAERKQDGGKFLIFEIPAMSGDLAPAVSVPYAGASAVTIDF